MTSSWPPKYYHSMPRGMRLSLIWAAYTLLTAPWSQPICRQFLYQILLLCTPACFFTGTVTILPSPVKVSAGGVPGKVLVAGGCRGGLCPGVVPASSSRPSTATAEPSNDAGSTFVKVCLRKGKTPFEYLCMLISCPLSLLLAVLVLGGGDAWKSLILMTYFHEQLFSFPSSFGFLH